MMRGLHARLTYTFIGIASGVLFLASMMIIIETHYHFQMVQHQMPNEMPDLPQLNFHLEQALEQSILWTLVGAILIAMVVSYFVAKRITAPLLEMRAVAERISQGQLDRRLKVLGHDELGQLGTSLNHLAEQLQQQEELRKNMTADVAHELRTPLATLKSHIEAMEDGIWEPTKERIHSCYEEIERLIHLVGDLEQLTFVESPEFQLHLKEEDLGQLVQQTVEMARPEFEQKGVHLLWEAPESIRLPMDRERMAQIMTNLLSNALKFTKPTGQVSVELERHEDAIVLNVHDTGIGIPAADLPYVFDRFYRAEKSRNRKSGGSGIGLAIVKRIVEAHGGEVTISSVWGEGTTVTVRFHNQ